MTDQQVRFALELHRQHGRRGALAAAMRAAGYRQASTATEQARSPKMHRLLRALDDATISPTTEAAISQIASTREVLGELTRDLRLSPTDVARSVPTVLLDGKVKVPVYDPMDAVKVARKARENAERTLLSWFQGRLDRKVEREKTEAMRKGGGATLNVWAAVFAQLSPAALRELKMATLSTSTLPPAPASAPTP